LENVAYPIMVSIKVLGIDTIELAHALGKVSIRGFDKQVVMVAH
jgi:hypothetical protein